MTAILLVTTFIIYLVLTIIETDSVYHIILILGLVLITGYLNLMVGIAIGLSLESVDTDEVE